MVEKVKIEGLRELERQLLKLELKVGKKVLRKAAMAAIKPITNQAKLNAAAIQDSGAIALAIGRWARFGKQVGSMMVPSRAAITVFTGPKSKNKRAVAAWSSIHHPVNPISRIRHAHLAEFGTSRSVGHFYMTRAYDVKKFETPRIFKVVMAREINKVRAR